MFDCLFILGRLVLKLTGNDFLDVRLGLVKELMELIAAMDHLGHEVPGLEGHVELELGYVVAEVFAGLRTIDRLFQVHGGVPQGMN
jgi:hypothetical protein